MAANRRFQLLVHRRGMGGDGSLSVEIRHFRAVASHSRKLFGRKNQIDVVQRTPADQRKGARGPHQQAV